jgi:hypothetical protein
VWSPITTSGNYCASDYAGHPDDALDFGGADNAFCYFYLTAGPFYGSGNVTSIVNSCSTSLYPAHRRMTLALYNNGSPAQYMGAVFASHVIPWISSGAWAWGGGTAFCRIGGPSGGTAIFKCWDAPHIHYGRVHNGVKLVNWINQCVHQPGGQTAIFNFTI